MTTTAISHGTNGSARAWDDECDLAQVRKQAADAALQSIRAMIAKEEYRKVALIGNPQVTVILLSDDEGAKA